MIKKNKSLPEGWKWVKIKDISEKSQYGFTTKAVDQGNTQLLRTTDITNGPVKWETVPYCREDPDDIKKYEVKEDDILISRAGSVGKSYLVSNLPQNNVVFASYLIRFKPKIESKLFKYFLESPQYWNSITEEKSGIAVPNVNATKLNAINFPLPPDDLRHRIVEKIEELFSELDYGVGSLKKAQKQLKTYRQAVLKDAFEGKLTKEWRERQTDLPTPEELLQQIKAERKAHRERQLVEWEKEVKQWEKDGKNGKKPSKPRKSRSVNKLTDDELSELHHLPENWYWGKINDITLRVEYGTSNKSLDEGDIPVLRMGNMQNGKIDWDDLKYSNDPKDNEEYLLEEGDVLFNRTNSPELVGKAVIYKGERPAIFAGYLIRLNQIKEVINSDYLNYFLNSVTAKNHGNKVKTDGVNQSNINGTKLVNYPFPICSKKEQDKIVQNIELRFSVIDQLEQTIRENLQKAEALRQSILKMAFNGELVKESNQEKTSTPAKQELTPFQQMQLIGILVKVLEDEYKLFFGEMALAKYLYLIDRIKKFQTGFRFKKWHYGPYDPKIKSFIYNKKNDFFRIGKNSTVKLSSNQDQLFKYSLDNIDQFKEGIHDISEIITKFKGKKPLGRQLELLATVCKVVENEKSTDLKTVRQGMQNWKIEGGEFKNKAEKFSKIETGKCLKFIKTSNWDKKLI